MFAVMDGTIRQLSLELPNLGELRAIAVTSMLKRCAPLRITDALGNAIAGHPLSIRLIDERQQRRAERIERRETEARNPQRGYL